MKEVKMGIIFYLAAMLIVPFENTQAQPDTGADIEDAKKAIAESNEIYFQAFVKHDASLLIGLYAEDCWIMLPNAPALCGPGAPGNIFQTGYDKFGIRNGKFITADVYGISEDIVAETGFFKIYDAGNAEIDDGKFMVLWKKTVKGWKMWREIFNSNRSIKGI
jgi:ketosteroid isomerase-like protein